MTDNLYIIMIVFGVVLFIGLFIFGVVKLVSKNNSTHDNGGGSDTPPNCKFNCGANGKCNIISGECDCYDGYRGDSCNITCPGENRDCNKNGKCNDSGTCDCYDGYRGDSCNITCPGENRDCNTNGKCNDIGICECDAGYTGSDCSSCKVTCVNGKMKTTSCECICDSPYNGSDCTMNLTNIEILDGNGVVHQVTPSVNSLITEYAITGLGTLSQYIWFKFQANVNIKVLCINGNCDSSSWSPSEIFGINSPLVGISANITLTQSVKFYIVIASETSDPIKYTFNLIP
jgi:hypothetical protein